MMNNILNFFTERLFVVFFVLMILIIGLISPTACETILRNAINETDVQ